MFRANLAHRKLFQGLRVQSLVLSSCFFHIREVEFDKWILVYEHPGLQFMATPLLAIHQAFAL